MDTAHLPVATVRRRFPRFGTLLVLLLVLGAAARLVRYLLNFPLWGDEAFVAVNFLVRDFRGMIEPLLYHQICPLGFMWAELLVVRLAGVSEWTLRLVPLAAGLVVLVLFWRFVRANFGLPIGLLAVGFLAPAYYPIRHAVEIKPYSTDLLVSLVITVAAWWVYGGPRRIERWVALVVFGGVSVWCSYPAVFVAGGAGVLLLYVLLRERTAAIGVGVVVYVVVLGSSFAAMYLTFARPHAEAVPEIFEIDMWTGAFPPVREPWKLLPWFIRVHTGNMLAYPMGARNGGSSVTFILAVAGIVALWRRHRALLLLLLSPPALNLVAAALQTYPYGETARTMLYAAPAICLLAGAGLCFLLGKLPPPHRLRGVRIAACMLGAVAIGSIVRDVIEPYKKPETKATRRTVNWLAERVQPADRVILFLAREQVDHAPWIGLAKGAGATLTFYLMWKLEPEIQFAPPLDAVGTSDTGRTWLLAFQRRRGGMVLLSRRQLGAYVDDLIAKLGEPARTSFELKDAGGDEQRVDVYCFGGAIPR